MEAVLQRIDREAPPVEYERPADPDDPLLLNLVIISRLFGSPKSPAALAAGLPIGQEGMTPDLFVKAADRIGLSASVLKRRLDKLTKLSLPAVLLLEGGDACVLLDLLPDGRAEIATPENLDGSQQVALSDLADRFTGLAITVRPKIRLDVRSSDLAPAAPKSWFWGTIRRFSPIYAEVVLAALLLNMFAVVSPIFVMQVYDRVVPNRAFETLWMLAIGAIAVFGFDFLLRTLRGYFLDRTGKTLDRRISGRIFEHIMSIRMASGPASSGAFANNIREFETLRDFFTSASLAAVVDLPFLFLFLGVIAMIGGPVAIVPAVLVPVVLVFSALVQIPMRRAVERNYRESAQKHATLIEALNGLDSIKAASAEGHLQRDWNGYVAASAQSATTSRLWSQISINFTSLAANLATVGVVIWGVYRTAEGDMTMGAMVACSMLTGRAMAPLGQISALIVRFHQSLTSLRGLNRLMELPSERPAGKVFLRRPQVDGAIEFRDVSFAYPGQQGKALDGISFRVAPGERVGIVGRIGSGKTTIERLALGLFEPQNGAVLVDGTDIRQLDPADLRRNIGCVLQDAHIFFGSVKDNIILGAPYVDEESVLRAAQVGGVDQFVKAHPHGFDMQVGEGGRYLSGGQRQAIAIARAMLMNPPILLLDEPTSHMDNSTENAFKSRLAEALPGKTLLLVTHRNSMLSLVDRLIVIDGGKIVADGPKSVVLDALTKGRIRATER
ncbi:MAG: ABC transporter [Alphaproteobacteria bacterium]|nr:MAG: ABC transporter [Alphaproteobacteria bacterium]